MVKVLEAKITKILEVSNFEITNYTSHFDFIETWTMDKLSVYQFLKSHTYTVSAYIVHIETIQSAPKVPL